MDRRNLFIVGVAAAGLLAIVVGVHQSLVEVAPGFDGRIVTGWDRSLSHEERLLAVLGGMGLVGAAGAIRWRRLGAIPVAAGSVVLLFTLRAVGQYAQRPGLYTEVRLHDGTTTRFVLGAEPFLLAGGALLLVTAGVAGWRTHRREADGGEAETAVGPVA
ncbi:hypothetical protein [Haloglomus litoreum]|uniref:hypothetical protein n=1 Tax=Haloglomus litoreum TaxID=3034026 RepID=UPI0023E8B9CF|nr:hypothetical protein [Haloglomus sp. DT116]